MEKGFRNFDITKLKMGGDPSPAPGGDTAVAEEDPDPTPAGDDPDPDPNADPTPEPKPGDNPDPKTDPEPKTDPVKDPEPKPGDDPNADPESPSDYTEEDFMNDASLLIHERTNGALKSIDDVQGILKRNQELEAALKVKEPEFKNPQAKVLYEHVIKAIGENPLSDKVAMSTAANYMRIASLDLATMTPKDKQLEAYVLTRPDISRSQAEKIFEKRYEQKFTDLEGDEIQADEHGIATREAEQKIANFQKEFNGAKKSEQPKEQPAENQEALQKEIDTVMQDFLGLSMQFGEGEEVVDLKLNDEEVSEFKSILSNPWSFMEKIFNQCVVNGKFDHGLYRDTMFRLYKGEVAIEEAHRAGFTAGQIKIVKDNKGSADTAKTTAATSTPKKDKPTFGQTMAAAIRASEGK